MHTLSSHLSFLCICFLTISQVQAQIPKGSWGFGGSLNFTTSENIVSNPTNNPLEKDARTSSQFTLSPGISYFVSSSTSLGMELRYRRSRYFEPGSGNRGSQTQTSQNWGFAPTLRYHMPMGERFALFVQGDIGIAWGNQYTIREDSAFTFERTYRQAGFEIGVRPGILMMLNKHWSLEASLGLISYSAGLEKINEEDWRYRQSRFNVNLNFASLGLGLRYYLL